MDREESQVDLYDRQEPMQHATLAEDLNGHQQTGDDALPVQKNGSDHSTHLTDVQSTRVLFRRKNFFVLARSLEKPRLLPRLAHGGVEGGFNGHYAIPGEPAVHRTASVLDGLIHPERNRSIVFPRSRTLTVPAWLETILVFI